MDVNYGDRLTERIRACATPALVGLDPRYAQLPGCLRKESATPEDMAAAYREFCRGIIDVVAPLVPAVKPQAAFFEQLGPPGMQALGDIVQYASSNGLLVVLDGKRGDIGSTAKAYADAYLGSGAGGTMRSAWGADALTVSPYLGDDSLQPFVDASVERGAGIYVLVKTSNPGGGMLQDKAADGATIYQHVATHIESLASKHVGQSGYGPIGAVVGATYPEQLAELRAAMPHTPLLVPGYGAQGGGARDVAAAFDADGLGAVINSSRGIIFAHSRAEYADRFGDANWQQAVEAATLDMIAALRAETPAGRLCAS
ncbi:MAG: orotidine-5'-phosphate decarboxylase [Pirellulales bacterium]|nr:orotidine-5'-phosphate decarboxylase [Pirellulales bacterium]